MKSELLAPAGSFEVMKAVIAAGADAVYMGLDRFSARAYADNAASADYAEAIRYAHLHGKKLYLTINTLFKEKELTEELPPVLDPLYRAGLDAVIVQDLGVMQLMHERYPLLPLHVSTQAAVTGPESAAYYKRFGAVRVVPAREMSLKEVKTIHDETGLELECFVHGALCYSYSGQCLFSSLAGGRSGNRGRCAQPCRMPYRVNEKGKPAYVLSLKDLCTIDILPELLENGVYSLKIEGRMKKAEYAAGVTAVYRKYLDLYEELSEKYGAEKAVKLYRAAETDKQALFELFNRKGFTDGYYKRHNSEKMLTMTEPDFREKNPELIRQIEEKYMKASHKAAVKGYYSFTEGAPMYMHLTYSCDGRIFETDTVSAEPVEKAAGRPADQESVEKQLLKTGGTEFFFEELDGEIAGSCFIPVSRLNAFRRQALEQLSEEVCRSYERILPEEKGAQAAGKTVDGPSENGDGKAYVKAVPVLDALVRTEAQFDAAAASPGIGEITVEYSIGDDYRELINRAHQAGKKIRLALPQILRNGLKGKVKISTAGFDSILVRSFEELSLINGLPAVSDHGLYGFNAKAEKVLLDSGFGRMTVPVELNSREIENTGYAGQEMIVYGRLPMMVTANCIKRTVSGCDGMPAVLSVKDRMGNVLPVYTDCRSCMNTIWNALPLCLSDQADLIGRMHFGVLRLNFTTEDRRETENIIRLFTDVFVKYEKNVPKPEGTTHGHFKRGVE